uniref:Uncharacterized protein n=3 Tax=Aegilops tauschii subsp. strangulata TaxID=200361 RepID=A0A453Q2X3_AEGTS
HFPLFLSPTFSSLAQPPPPSITTSPSQRRCRQRKRAGEHAAIYPVHRLSLYLRTCGEEVAGGGARPGRRQPEDVKAPPEEEPGWRIVWCSRAGCLTTIVVLATAGATEASLSFTHRS